MWEKIYVLYQTQKNRVNMTCIAVGADKFGGHSDMLVINKISTSVVKSLKKNKQKFSVLKWKMSTWQLLLAKMTVKPNYLTVKWNIPRKKLFSYIYIVIRLLASFLYCLSVQSREGHSLNKVP